MVALWTLRLRPVDRRQFSNSSRFTNLIISSHNNSKRDNNTSNSSQLSIQQCFITNNTSCHHINRKLWWISNHFHYSFSSNNKRRRLFVWWLPQLMRYPKNPKIDHYSNHNRQLLRLRKLSIQERWVNRKCKRRCYRRQRQSRIKHRNSRSCNNSSFTKVHKVNPLQ